MQEIPTLEFWERIGKGYALSYGIGELARCCSIVRRTGGEIKLAGVTKKVQDVLEISRMNTLFEIYPAESAAHQAFGQRV